MHRHVLTNLEISRWTSVLYLPCNQIILALRKTEPVLVICHKKWQSFNFHLHFHHETPCQAWVGSKALFSSERRPSSSAVLQGGCSSPSSHLFPSPQAGPAEPGNDWLFALSCVILCSRVMSPWLTITAHSVLLFCEPLNGSLAFNKTAEPAPNPALTPLCLDRVPPELQTFFLSYLSPYSSSTLQFHFQS